MKKAILIAVIVILVLALLGGTIACAILFSNDQLIYNAIATKDEQLAEHCQGAYDKLTSNSYFEIKFTNPNNANHKSILKVYINEYDNLIAKLTTYRDGLQEDYHFERTNKGSVVYYSDDLVKLKNKSISFNHLMQSALSLSDDYLPNLEKTAIDLSRPFNGKTFEKERYIEHKKSNKAIFDLVNDLIAVEYQFALNDENNELVYTINITIDKDNTIRKMQILVDNTTIDVEFLDMTNSRALLMKTPEEDSQYIEAAPL